VQGELILIFLEGPLEKSKLPQRVCEEGHRVGWKLKVTAGVGNTKN
jgi:hypothetical protein